MTSGTEPAGLTGYREFRIDRVLGGAFSLLGRKLPRYFLLAAILEAPTLLAGLMSDGMTARISRWITRYSLDSGDPGTVALEILSALALVLLWLLLYNAIQVAILYGVLQDLRGQPFRLATGLRRGLSRFWALIGLSLAYAIAVGLASLLLLVPGIILICVWWVAIAACALEELGPLKSLDRSAELTKGHRWRIFAIFLVVMVGGSIVNAVLGVAASMAGQTPAAIVGFLWETLTTAYYLIAVAVAYHELRVAREGIDTDRIAAVFD